MKKEENNVDNGPGGSYSDMIPVCYVQMVQAYTGSDSVMEAATGERFVLMGGNIMGEFTELVSQHFILAGVNVKGGLHEVEQWLGIGTLSLFTLSCRKSHNGEGIFSSVVGFYLFVKLHLLTQPQPLLSLIHI